MFCLQTGDNEACVWDPHLNLFILIRDRKCYNLSPRTFAHYDHRVNMRLQLVSHLIKLREPESGEDRDLFTAFIYKLIGCFSDPATARRAIRTVLIEKEDEDKRAVEQVIDDVFMRKIMSAFPAQRARMGLWGLVTSPAGRLPANDATSSSTSSVPVTPLSEDSFDTQAQASGTASNCHITPAPTTRRQKRPDLLSPSGSEDQIDEDIPALKLRKTQLQREKEELEQEIARLTESKAKGLKDKLKKEVAESWELNRELKVQLEALKMECLEDNSD